MIPTAEAPPTATATTLGTALQAVATATTLGTAPRAVATATTLGTAPQAEATATTIGTAPQTTATAMGPVFPSSDREGLGCCRAIPGTPRSWRGGSLASTGGRRPCCSTPVTTRTWGSCRASHSPAILWSATSSSTTLSGWVLCTSSACLAVWNSARVLALRVFQVTVVVLYVLPLDFLLMCLGLYYISQLSALGRSDALYILLCVYRPPISVGVESIERAQSGVAAYDMKQWQHEGVRWAGGSCHCFSVLQIP